MNSRSPLLQTVLSQTLSSSGLFLGLMLLVASLASSQTAIASCGDYLLMDGSSHARAGAHDSDPVPCNGPNCSGRALTFSLPVVRAERLSLDLAKTEIAVQQLTDCLTSDQWPQESYLPSFDSHLILRPPIA